MKNIWTYHEQESSSEENLFGSEKDFGLVESDNDLLKWSVGDNSSLNAWQDKLIRKSSVQEKLKKLTFVKLDSISIPPTTPVQHTCVHLNQSFNIGSSFMSANETSTQTSEIDFLKNRLISGAAESPSQRSIKRPNSLPPENIALHNLSKRVQADVEPKFERRIDVGAKGDIQVENTEVDLKSPNHETATQPVQCSLETSK